MPTITTLSPLTQSDLLRILTDVRGSLISQYTSLFGYSGVDIKFTTAALKEICRKSAERGGGARGLRGIMVLVLFFGSSLSVPWRENRYRKTCYSTLCMRYREYSSPPFRPRWLILFSQRLCKYLVESVLRIDLLDTCTECQVYPHQRGGSQRWTVTLVLGKGWRGDLLDSMGRGGSTKRPGLIMCNLPEGIVRWWRLNTEL